MRFVITGEYDIEDSPVERLNNYGTEDLAECAQIDMEHDPGSFLFLGAYRLTMFHIEPADPEGGTREPAGASPDSPAPGETGLPGPGEQIRAAYANPDHAWPNLPVGTKVILYSSGKMA